MSYLVLARRFRPQTFEEIVGQEHVTKTLQNAISTDRVAHAFLFSGARGVGKTTAARVLAKALNCVEGPTTTPCGECEQCQGIAESRAVDVQEIDGASNNSVDDVRALRETVPYQPSSGRFKIYIVDEVHMLTSSAFNALLKTLEEPPAHVKFIFATTEPRKIPVTILSRCQRYDFRLVPTPLILKRLEGILEVEGVEAEPTALSLLAREAQGSMRDALSLLDQALAFSSDKLEAQEVARLLGVADRKLLLMISRALLEHDAALALQAVNEAAVYGCDLTKFASDVLHLLRNLVVIAQCPKERDLVDLSEEELEELRQQIVGHEVAELHRLFLLFSRATEEIARSSQPKLLLEMTLARLASLESMRSIEELAARLEQFAAAGGAPVAAAGAQRSVVESRRVAPETRRQMPTTRRQQPDSRRAQISSPSASPLERESAPSMPASRLHEEPTRAAGAQAEEKTRSSSTGDAAPAEMTWANLLGHIKKKSPPLFHLLRYAEPVSFTPEGIKLRLPDEPFFRGEAKNTQRLEGIRKVCQKIFGVDAPVELVVADGDETSTFERAHIESAAREHDRRREAMEHTMVRAALSEFEGAKIETIRLHDKK